MRNMSKVVLAVEATVPNAGQKCAECTCPHLRTRRARRGRGDATVYSCHRRARACPRVINGGER